MELTNENDRLKRILVTGGRGFLGTHVIEQFIDAGCTVIAADLVLEHDGLKPDANIHRLHWARLDATNPASVRALVGEIVDRFGALDGLIHCAGGFRFAHADKVEDSDIDFLINANLRSSILMVRECLSAMRQDGFGRMVLVSSASTLHPGAGVSTYAATKAGLNALVQSIAEEVKDEDININAILPSVIDTQSNRSDMPDADYNKWVDPRELARLIFIMTQPIMNSVRGALVPVTAGM